MAMGEDHHLGPKVQVQYFAERQHAIIRGSVISLSQQDEGLQPALDFVGKSVWVAKCR